LPGVEGGLAAAALVEVLEKARRDHAANRLAQAAEGYGRALGVDGRAEVALLGLSLVARQSGQREAALRMAGAALGSATNPAGAALALAHVGHCLAGLGRLGEAEGAFRRILAWPGVGSQREAATVLAQARLQAHLGLGEVLVTAGRAGEAAEEFRQAIAIEPGVAAVHFGLGNALALEEDWAGALGCFGRVVGLLAGSPEGHFGVAFCRGKLGDFEGAIAGYRRALELRPGFAGAWLNLGVSLVEDGRDGLGEACYREVLGMTGADGTEGAKQARVSALLNLGHLERGRGRFSEALRRYGEALGLVPGEGRGRLAEIQVAFCSWHLEQGQFPQAWRALREAERTGSENAEVANVRGILLLGEEQGRGTRDEGLGTRDEGLGTRDEGLGTRDEGRGTRDEGRGTRLEELGRKAGTDYGGEGLIEEAVGAFWEAERLGHRTAGSNRGNALLRVGRCEEALRAHEEAVRRNPVHAGVRYNLALTQLRMGDFRWGWMNYEARWAFRDVHARPRRFGVPRWEGEAGGILFVYAEQGLGDTVQFARFLPGVAERLMAGEGEAGLVVEVQRPLVRLMEPLVKGLEERFAGLRARVVGGGDALPAFSRHCPLMSFPAVMGTEVRMIPCQVPYLVVGLGPELETRTEGRLAVGVAWAGNPRYKADGERSTRLETFLPLLKRTGIRWVSLQKGAEAEIQVVRERLPAGCELKDGCSADRDLADTAAVIAGLDMVITTDTVIAHVAGAMGKPVWILLPWQADWRWMQERETTPWYPTARLFRQARRHGWGELVERVSHELEERMYGGKIGGVGL